MKKKKKKKAKPKKAAFLLFLIFNSFFKEARFIQSLCWPISFFQIIGMLGQKWPREKG